MEQIEFKGSIWKTGNSYVVTVPKPYIENGQLSESEEYKITITRGERDDKKDVEEVLERAGLHAVA